MEIEKLDTLDGDALFVLSPALAGDALYFKSAIDSGECELWRIDFGDSFAITRLEIDHTLGQVDSGKNLVLVVCCFAGKNIRRFSRHVIEVCDRNNWSIRMHCTDERIAKLMQRNYGFNEPELILKRGLNYGR